jgi:hypothetical protein
LTTPHQRRLRELEASRRLQRILQELVEKHPGAVPSVVVADAFECCGSLLPQESELLQQFQLLSEGLRSRSASHIGEDSLRRVITALRDRSDKVASRVEARDLKLRRKR